MCSPLPAVMLGVVLGGQAPRMSLVPPLILLSRVSADPWSKHKSKGNVSLRAEQSRRAVK